MERKEIYRFSKEKFSKNAPRKVKEKLKYILDDIDNLVVNFNSGENGTCDVDWYGTIYELYPVKKEWCIVEEHFKLIPES